MGLSTNARYSRHSGSHYSHPFPNSNHPGYRSDIRGNRYSIIGQVLPRINLLGLRSKANLALTVIELDGGNVRADVCLDFLGQHDGGLTNHCFEPLSLIRGNDYGLTTTVTGSVALLPRCPQSLNKSLNLLVIASVTSLTSRTGFLVNDGQCAEVERLSPVSLSSGTFVLTSVGSLVSGGLSGLGRCGHFGSPQNGITTISIFWLFSIARTIRAIDSCSLMMLSSSALISLM